MFKREGYSKKIVEGLEYVHEMSMCNEKDVYTYMLRNSEGRTRIKPSGGSDA